MRVQQTTITTVGMCADFTLEESNTRSPANSVRIGMRKFHMNTIMTVTNGSLLKGWMLLRIIAGYQEVDHGNHGVLPRTMIYAGNNATSPCVIVRIITRGPMVL